MVKQRRLDLQYLEAMQNQWENRTVLKPEGPLTRDPRMVSERNSVRKKQEKISIL